MPVKEEEEAVGQIGHLPWVQNGLVGFEKKHTICKKQYMC
jgi:hypothetical protein